MSRKNKTTAGLYNNNNDNDNNNNNNDDNNKTILGHRTYAYACVVRVNPPLSVQCFMS